MKQFNKILNESVKLTVFEMLDKLQGFLAEKYGIKAYANKKDNMFDLFISKYVTDDGKEKDLSEAIKKFVDGNCSLDNVEVVKTKFGYEISFGEDGAAKLIETTQAQGTGMADSKKTFVCSFCGKEEHGYGNDPWPLDTHAEHRVCDECNTNLVIPARVEQLFKKHNKTEAVTKEEIEHEASNLVLDDKYTWLFSVLDVNGRDIEEGIEYLQDAIDLTIKDDAAFLVAFPYVDPKPEDQSVDLVFADNPGPVIIYNNEKATVSKKELERPTKEEQPKKEEETVEESVITEAYDKSEAEAIGEAMEKLSDLMHDLNKYYDLYKGSKAYQIVWHKLWDTYQDILDVHEDVTKYNFHEAYEGEEDFTLNEVYAEEEEFLTDKDEEYVVYIGLTREWYDSVEEEFGADYEVYEEQEFLIQSIESMLAQNDIFMSFDYIGERQWDYVSNVTQFEEAAMAEDVINRWFGGWVEIAVRRRPF